MENLKKKKYKEETEMDIKKSLKLLIKLRGDLHG